MVSKPASKGISKVAEDVARFGYRRQEDTNESLGVFQVVEKTKFLLHFEFISHIIIIMCLREKEKGSEGYEVEEI